MSEDFDSRYRNVRLVAEADGARLRFEIENTSKVTWLSGNGLSASYQVFDPESGMLLVDGARVPLSGNISPGEREAFNLALDLPSEAGKYRVYACPMREQDGWAFERGYKFVLADLTVAADRSVQAGRVRVTDQAAFRRATLVRSLQRVFLLPVQTVWRNRSLSATLVKREILSRSRGSFGGGLWTVLSPLLLMLTYFLVFGLILNQKFEDDARPGSWTLYFLAGMLPWLAFSEAAGRAPTVLIEYRQLIKKLVFPIETLPVNLMYSGLVGEAFGLLLFIPACLLLRGHLPWTVVYLPLLLIPQMIFTTALCWFMSALGAFFRDLAQINGFLMTIWFFITPICYSEKQMEHQIPAGARRILTGNPMFILVRGYRSIFLEGHAPDWNAILGLTFWSLVLALLAHGWFYKLRKSFVDVL
jgi:lipopolysaccharide transport system permease protein